MNQASASVQRDLKRWSAHLLLRRAVQLAQRGELEEAGQLVVRSFALDPAVAEAQLIRGKILFWQGQFDAAELAFKESLRLGLALDRCTGCLAALEDERRRNRAWSQLIQDLAEAKVALTTQGRRLGHAILGECSLERGAQLTLVLLIVALLWNRS